MKNNRYIKGLIRYFRRTFKNKVVATAMLLLGTVATMISYDATALVFLSLLAVPMFFANENWIYED